VLVAGRIGCRESRSVQSQLADGDPLSVPRVTQVGEEQLEEPEITELGWLIQSISAETYCFPKPADMEHMTVGGKTAGSPERSRAAGL